MLAAGGGLTLLFLHRFRPASTLLLGDLARPLAAALITALAVLTAGFAAVAIAQRIFGTRGGAPVSAIDALLVGYPLFGTLVGAIAWISTAPVVPVTIAAAAAGVVLLLRRRVDVRIAAPSLLLAIPILLAIVEAITPANSPDELTYKLAVPQQYLLYGRMLELPLSSNSYLVLGTNLTDLAALAIGGPVAAKLARLLLYLAALGVVHRFARRLAGGAANWIAAVVAWCPTLMLIAGWAWSEWAVVGLIVLALERFERWLDVRDPSDAAIAFAAAGAAAAAKYTALPFLLAFGIVALLRMRDAKLLARAALVVALFGAFFYVRNVVWTGSPFAPLLLPNSPRIDNYRSGGRFSGFTDLVHGWDVVDPNLLDESLGIVVPLAAIAALALVARRDRVTRDLLIAGGVQMPILLTIAPASRNMIGGVVPLALAGAMFLAELWRRSPRPMRVLLGGGAAIAFAAQLVLVLYVVETYDVLPYLGGKESAAAYVARTRHFAKPFGWIAASTPADARILLLGESETLYLQRQAVSASNLDGPRLAAWLAAHPSPELLRAELQRMGITHVLIGLAHYRVGGPPPGMIEKETLLQVPPSTDVVLRAMLARDAALRYRDPGYLVFELR